MAQPFRAFVAVHVDVGPGLVALADGLRATGADLKVVPPENVHLTLRFLGDVAPADEATIVRVMTEAVADVAPFTGTLEGVGSFGPRDSPRVVWLGVRGVDALAAVAARLDAGFAAAGVAEPDARGFKPHVTLARARSGRGAQAVAAFVAAHEHAQAGEVPVVDVRLVESELTPTGPVYTVRHAVSLGGL